MSLPPFKLIHSALGRHYVAFAVALFSLLVVALLALAFQLAETAEKGASKSPRRSGRKSWYFVIVETPASK